MPHITLSFSLLILIYQRHQFEEIIVRELAVGQRLDTLIKIQAKEEHHTKRKQTRQCVMR